MKSILKLAACMAAGLLIISCSHHSHSGSISTVKPSASTHVARGVLEKGKVTAATCEVVTLSDGKTLYKATVKDGAYVADVPAGPFGIDCKVTAYINDKTGKSETVTKPIDLKTFSSANADDKEKTLNINVLTTLVADQVGVAKKGNFTGITAQSLEEAETAAKEAVDKKYGIVIGDIDTLSLKSQGVLAEVSLAVQTAMDGGKTFDKATDDLDKNQVQAEKGKTVNPNAVASSNKDLKPPAPKPVTPTNDKGKPTAGKLAALTGGATIATKPIIVDPGAVDIDASQAVAVSIPASLVTISDASKFGVYISGKAGVAPLPLTVATGATAYTNTDVSGLFDGTKPTTFTVCITSTAAIKGLLSSGTAGIPTAILACTSGVTQIFKAAANTAKTTP